MTHSRPFLTGLLLLTLSACAGRPSPPPPASPCAAGESEQVVVEMFFGLNIGPNNSIPRRQWEIFVNEVIAPAFPDGFTLLDGTGRYLSASTQTVVRERAKILIVAAPDGPVTQERIRAVADAYKTRFKQESVGILRAPVCASF